MRVWAESDGAVTLAMEDISVFRRTVVRPVICRLLKMLKVAGGMIWPLILVI